MATKKEMVAELVALGANEDEIKDLKNTELEAMLEKAKEASVPDEKTAEEPEVPVAEEPKAQEAEAESEAPAAEGDKEEVVRETSQQLGIFRDYIYNVKNKGAKVIVENLGYGDAYVDSDDLAIAGKSKRISFKETAEFVGVDRLHFVSASQPVIQILEVK